MRLLLVALAIPVAAGLARAAVRLAPRPRRRRDGGGSLSGRWGRPTATVRAVIGSFRRHRRAAAVERELPVFLEGVARALRSGLSSEGAVVDSTAVLEGPLRDDVGAIGRSLDLGASLDEALGSWQRSPPHTGLALAAAALSLGATGGGGRAQAVDAVAATLRERAAVKAEVVSLSTQARASAMVMAATPVAFLVLAASADPGTAGFLLTTRFGLACLLCGLVLEASGAAWMLVLTRAAT